MLMDTGAIAGIRTQQPKHTQEERT
jgi:hypothetical protein